MKRFMYIAIMAAFLTGCAEKESTSPLSKPGSEKANITLNVDFPSSDLTKVGFNESDTTKLTWKGDETMTLIFGDVTSETKKDNKVNPMLQSVAPGVFSGTVTTPEGYDMTNLQGLVVSGDVGAYFYWAGADDKRISMPIPAEQVQAVAGEPNWDYIPFFYDLAGSELEKKADDTYGFNSSLVMKSAADMMKFNIYGKHPEMSDDEVFKSVMIKAVGYGTVSKVVISGNSDWTLEGTGTGLNSYGTDYIKVSLTEQQTMADKTAENPLEIFAGIILGGTRYIGVVEIQTDKATYTKSFASPKKYPQKAVWDFNVFTVNLDLSTFDSAAGILYTTDPSDENSWSYTIPSEFESLYVKTRNHIMTSEDLLVIKTAIDDRKKAVSLDLSAAQYETYIFPTTFAGTSGANNLYLKSIKFPGNITEIKASAFAYASGLESVDLTGIKTINTKAFYYSGLKTLNVPKSVTSIPGYLAFGCCSKLTEVFFDSPASQVGGNGSSGTNHATFAFASMTGNTKNPAQVTFTDEVDCVFTFGPNAKRMTRYMFKYNTNLKKIVIQKKLDYITNYALQYTYNLHTFDCTGDSTPTNGPDEATYKYSDQVGRNPLKNGTVCKILVPKGAKDAYAAKSPWSYLIKRTYDTGNKTAEGAAIMSSPWVIEEAE